MSKTKTAWGYLMTALIIIGLFPTFSPQLAYNKDIVSIFYLATSILVSRVIFSLIKGVLEKKKIAAPFLDRISLIVDFFLISGFLFFFDQINGSLFLLYLLIIIEALWKKDILLSNALILATAIVTTSEFVFLATFAEVPFDFLSFSRFFFRVASLAFLYLYGSDIREEKIAIDQSYLKNKKDMLKLERLSAEINRTNAKLQEISALKDEFVSVASHELRAPMTMIKGYISMVLEGSAGKIPQKVQEFLQDAYEGNDRMIRLVNNMLNVSRIESGKLIMSLKDVCLEKIVAAVVGEYQSEATKHGLHLEFKKPIANLPKVRLDPDRIQEVITNLVVNAINYTPHGEIVVSLGLKEDQIVFKIKDSGVGISPESQKQLFKKFSQVEVSSTFKKGSGLGLYICRMLINEFGGKIWVNSKLGKGASFYFTLPAINFRKQKGDLPENER